MLNKIILFVARVAIICFLITDSLAIESSTLINKQPIRVPLHSVKITLDPSKIQDMSSLWVSRQINCQLLRTVGGVQLFEAAKSVHYLNPEQIEFTINNNVRFNDGSQITSDDVIATLNFLNKRRIVLRNIFTWIKEVKKINENTFIITLNHHVPQFLRVLASPNYPIFKKEFILKAYKNPSLWNKPIGCGNYRIQENKKNVIKLNPITNGYPITFHLLPNSQILADQINKYDIVGLEVIGKSPKLSNFDKLNIFDPFQYYLYLNTRIAPWNSQKERCAFLAKLNFDNVIKLYGNDVIPANDFLPSGTMGYDASVNFMGEIKKQYANQLLPPKSSFCVAYLQSSIEQEFRPAYLDALRTFYPHASIKLIDKSGNLMDQFAKSHCDGMFIALKSNYLDAYEYLLTLSEDGINISGFQNSDLTAKIQNSQQFEDAATRAKEYRSIIDKLQALCIVYPLFTRSYETVYVNKRLVLPNFGKGGINDYYLGNVSIK